MFCSLEREVLRRIGERDSRTFFTCLEDAFYERHLGIPDMAPCECHSNLSDGFRISAECAPAVVETARSLHRSLKEEQLQQFRSKLSWLDQDRYLETPWF